MKVSTHSLVHGSVGRLHANGLVVQCLAAQLSLKGLAPQLCDVAASGGCVGRFSGQQLVGGSVTRPEKGVGWANGWRMGPVAGRGTGISDHRWTCRLGTSSRCRVEGARNRFKEPQETGVGGVGGRLKGALGDGGFLGEGGLRDIQGSALRGSCRPERD